MRLPPIEPMDVRFPRFRLPRSSAQHPSQPTIHISSLPEEAEERHESSENDAGEFNAISVISRVPSVSAVEFIPALLPWKETVFHHTHHDAVWYTRA
ncbi:hypothetical protein BKA82DRAFT_1009080 [Pisolithus tinctorius]|nr:hypothetical protein BKA82DRAFT_1009080 [Pisolithus tinctorius]